MLCVITYVIVVQRKRASACVSVCIYVGFSVTYNGLGWPRHNVRTEDSTELDSLNSVLYLSSKYSAQHALMRAG